MSRRIKDIQYDIDDAHAHIIYWQTTLAQLEGELLRADATVIKKPRRTPEEVRRRNEIRRAEFVAKMKEGDFIRLVGVRNTRFNWRKVVTFDDHQVTGWTYSRDKWGKFIQGGAGVTTNGTDKIVELVPSAGPRPGC